MAQDKQKPFEVPEQLRSLTQDSVDQARKAFDDYVAATRAAVSKLEATSSDAQTGALDLNRKILELAEENVSSAFTHAQRLVGARDLQEIMTLQSEFLKRQMANLGEQARVLSDAGARTASEFAGRTTER
ncbi:phasin family protein [Prosthecomicrobium hirschii]|jgi:phasin|uniref:phasin family protein n=1 Tax=Prosthecodimorpha hirschii TaxID=665126 RepID=UPI00112AF3AD|nr:phasin family protein [Prosthecomicrobium hirschii]MCW1843884.1 phasin family protein [Prosthecomicrobium hirschii]TPQ52704.1 phasin [Prosthecomicrobium hirschii]